MSTMRNHRLSQALEWCSSRSFELETPLPTAEGSIYNSQSPQSSAQQKSQTNNKDKILRSEVRLLHYSTKHHEWLSP